VAEASRGRDAALERSTDCPAPVVRVADSGRPVFSPLVWRRRSDNSRWEEVRAKEDVETMILMGRFRRSRVYWSARGRYGEAVVAGDRQKRRAYRGDDDREAWGPLRSVMAWSRSGCGERLTRGSRPLVSQGARWASERGNVVGPNRWVGQPMLCLVFFFSFFSLFSFSIFPNSFTIQIEIQILCQIIFKSYWDIRSINFRNIIMYLYIYYLHFHIISFLLLFPQILFSLLFYFIHILMVLKCTNKNPR
jgi:hypothetical protein